MMFQEKLTYRSSLKAEEVLQRLQEATEARQMFRSTGIFADKNRKSFEGSIKGNTFDISPIITYRNSFLPRIYGEVEKKTRESRAGTHDPGDLCSGVYVYLAGYCWGGFHCFYQWRTKRLRDELYDFDSGFYVCLWRGTLRRRL